MLMHVYEWQLPLWRRLLADAGKIPHALLMAGPQGLGKLAFAQDLAARLLCERDWQGLTADGMACGRCNSCIWLTSDNHPDFRQIQPDDVDESAEDGGQEPQAGAPGRKAARAVIRVDQIRALTDFVYMGSHRQGNRVVVISPAESMHPAAANSLLKILEEPPAGVYFILISIAWRKLIPTLRSRCRLVAFGRPDAPLADRWLAARGVANSTELLRLVGGAPLLAAEWAEQGRLDSYQEVIAVLAGGAPDPVAMAAKWGALIKAEHAYGLPQLVETVQKWVFDLALLKSGGVVRYHESWRDKLEMLATKASATALLAGYADLLRIRAVAQHPLNAQLFLEDMAARYLRSLSPARAA